MTKAAETRIVGQSGDKDAAIWVRAGLIGGTGFVGRNLLGQRPFARDYSSKTIREIADERFSTLICAGAPATMWAANDDPDGDRANLQRLAERIATTRFERLVLISTIAVLDDAGAGYTESSAKFETDKAYGRNRRELEVTLTERHGAVILRLPALFGDGLRKNFVFDLINPVPSFLKPALYETLSGSFTEAERAAAAGVYRFDDSFQMMRLDRDVLDRTPARALLTAALRRANFLAPNFTNCQSTFQFYNLSYLARDIERCLGASIPLLHVCSEPLRAGDVHEALLGKPFISDRAPVVHEDMRSDHAPLWGSQTRYLYRRDEVLAELLQFARARLA